MKKVAGWLFRDAKGMPVELREFGPREHFPKGGWELVESGTEGIFLTIGLLPLENAKGAVEKEFAARGYQLMWDLLGTLEEFFQQ